MDLIRTESLNKYYGKLAAVKNVSFSVNEGEVLGLLGESGCGKTTIARILMGLEQPDGGEVFYQGGPAFAGRSFRGARPLRRELQMVSQNPYDCLDPMMTVGRLLEEPLKIWRIGTNKKERIGRIRQLLEECSLPADCLGKHPEEFSGGQLQRLSIARALLVQPRFLVADEIVSALDVPVQAQILDLLCELKERHNLTILFISHDIAVVRRISDRVMVMRGGQEVCSGKIDDVLKKGTDPYVDELLSAQFCFI